MRSLCQLGCIVGDDSIISYHSYENGTCLTITAQRPPPADKGDDHRIAFNSIKACRSLRISICHEQPSIVLRNDCHTHRSVRNCSVRCVSAAHMPSRTFRRSHGLLTHDKREDRRRIALLTCDPRPCAERLPCPLHGDEPLRLAVHRTGFPRRQVLQLRRSSEDLFRSTFLPLITPHPFITQRYSTTYSVDQHQHLSLHITSRRHTATCE